MNLQIKCVVATDRPDPQERISHIGGTFTNGKPWKITQVEAIANIETRLHTFHILVNGRRTNVEVASLGGRKYIKTASDSLHPDKLLALAACPV